MMRAILWLAAVVLSAATVTSSASAAVVTRHVSLTANDFTEEFGPAAAAPYSTVTEEFTLTFDPDVSVVAVDNGLTINEFTLDYGGSNYSYDATDDLLIVGSDTQQNGFEIDDLDYQYALIVSGLLSEHPLSDDFEYTDGANHSLWQSDDVTVEVTTAPEAPDWVLMIIGVAAAGAGLRLRRRLELATP